MAASGTTHFLHGVRIARPFIQSIGQFDDVLVDDLNSPGFFGGNMLLTQEIPAGTSGWPW